MTYYVRGGVYTDATFTVLAEDGEEIYGPFTSYDDAHGVWSAESRAKLDNCCHRLLIITLE